MIILLVSILNGIPVLSYAVNLDKVNNVQPVTKIPDDVGSNSSYIDASMVNRDPAFTLGSLVDLTEKTVMGLNYLKPQAKLVTETKNDLAFRNFIQEGLEMTAAWLSFLRGHLNFNNKAEVTKTRITQCNLNRVDLKEDEIIAYAMKLYPSLRKHYAVIIGYDCFQVNASFYQDRGVDAGANGFGAKIDGKWFSKTENTMIDNYLRVSWIRLDKYVAQIKTIPTGAALGTLLKEEKIKSEEPEKPIESLKIGFEFPPIK